MANSIPFRTKIIGAGLLDVRFSKLDVITAQTDPDQTLKDVVRAVRCSMNQVVRVDRDNETEEIILTIDHHGDLGRLTKNILTEMNRRGATRKDLARAATDMVNLGQRLKTIKEVKESMAAETETAQEVTSSVEYSTPQYIPTMSSKVDSWVKVVSSKVDSLLRRDLEDGRRVLRWFRRFRR